MTTFSVRKDPMLSGLHSVSPNHCSPVGGTFDNGQLNVGGSPNHSGMLMTGSPSHMFVGGQPQNLTLKPESPTLMTTDTPENVSSPCGSHGNYGWEFAFMYYQYYICCTLCVCVCVCVCVCLFVVQIQDQIIEDIMGLEEKFGETLGGLPYLDTSLMAPQTVGC